LRPAPSPEFDVAGVTDTSLPTRDIRGGHRIHPV